MISNKNVRIYFDPKSKKYHNPEFGNMECGRRVDFCLEKYKLQNYFLVFPKNNLDQNLIIEFFGKNIVVKYLSETNLDLNSMKSSTKALFLNRNCHGCTTETQSEICHICKTVFDKNNFYKYVYTLDSTIADSDTTYYTHTTLVILRNAVNLVCQMIDDLQYHKTKYGFAIIRPPGHHATYNKSTGFCIINNIAVCANYALKIGFTKIFIFDFDAHHGNGTQEIFYKKSNVFYCSIHTLESYPKTGLPTEKGIEDGTGFNLNIVVQKNICTKDYICVFKENVLPAIFSYKPDLILISAGFDGLETDPMQIMNLTIDSYTDMLVSLKQFNLPMGLVLEGGYDIENLHKCFDACLKVLS